MFKIHISFSALVDSANKVLNLFLGRILLLEPRRNFMRRFVEGGVLHCYTPRKSNVFESKKEQLRKHWPEGLSPSIRLAV